MRVSIHQDADGDFVLTSSNWEPELRDGSFRARRAILEVAKQTVARLLDLGRPVYAVAAANQPGAARLLERMGFRHVIDRTYLFERPMLDKIMEAERVMREHGTPVEIPVTHHWANKGTKHGAYAREIRIPKGAIVTGKVHRTEQINVLLEGTIRVSVGDEMVLMTGPQVVVSPAGTKRIAYAETDVRWLTFHATELTDLVAIERQFIEPEMKLCGGMAQLEEAA